MAYLMISTISDNYKDMYHEYNILTRPAVNIAVNKIDI